MRTAPEWFKAKLELVDPSLVVTWNAYNHRWQVWMPSPRIKHPYCAGWNLLFIVQDSQGRYAPLDERVLARLYHSSADKWGSGKKYFDAIVAEELRARESKHKQDLADQMDMAMEHFDHSQIKVAMRGPSSGSKFSTFHS